MDRDTRYRRLLVVDDDALNAQLLGAQLEALGYSVDCALDGNRAVTMVCTADYDAVLLDLGLPEYDGVEVLRILRKRMLRHPARVIVLTGDAERTRLHDLNREGIDAYLTKPVDMAILGPEVARLTEKDHLA